VAVQLLHRTGHTVVTETVVVDRVHGRVSTHVGADVQDRHLVLRWEAPTTLSASAAEADGLWGMSRHPTVPEGSNDQAAFEWVAHRFVSLAEQAVGLVIANDGRYGHSVDGGRLGVTLSTAPLYPDPDADQRPSPVSLLLMPHDGCWATPSIVGEAYAWSWGMVAERAETSPSGAFAALGPIPDQVVVLGCWPAADGSRDVVVTLGETYGTGADFWLAAPWAARGAAAVDPVTEVGAPDGGQVVWASDRQAAHVVLKAHGIVALRFQRA
jgi:alpha-mannosidase